MTITIKETGHLVTEMMKTRYLPAPQNEQEAVLTVQAWFDALNGHVTYEQARDGLGVAAAGGDSWITPGKIIAAVRESDRVARNAVAPVQTRGRIAHCGLTECVCVHDGECQYGWIDSEDGKSTRPCRQCRGELASRVDSVPAAGHRNNHDLAVLRGKSGLGDAV